MLKHIFDDNISRSKAYMLKLKRFHMQNKNDQGIEDLVRLSQIAVDAPARQSAHDRVQLEFCFYMDSAKREC